ncbi:cAMP-specific 3p 5p-cyclic phosphodiesterase 4D-like isoform X2 [Biomphalaria glabrata]|nr:cAMP-specific 3'; 5'-cyclic phosphodiesterase 4D-like isoform X2 [Biomphalaria glabrata]
MERRYSIQPVLRKDSKEDDEKKAQSHEPGRRLSVFPNFGKSRTWVKRSNLAPDHVRPFPETRSSWDESMRRRDSDTGLRGIVLRKGFSDDSKNYSLFHSEYRRYSKPEPPAYFSPGKSLCKWETVNLLGTKESPDALSSKLESGDLRVTCSAPSREDSGIEVTSAKTLTPGSSKFGQSYLLENLIESDEMLCYAMKSSQTEMRLDSEEKEDDVPEMTSHENRRKRVKDGVDSTSEDSPDGSFKKEDTEGRRPSIIPTLNITKEQSNFEKFLDIISGQREIPESKPGEETAIARTKSCETFTQPQAEAISIWERRKRAAGGVCRGTKPIVLNIEAMDDSMFYSRSVSNTLVEISGFGSTYICKDDMHLSSLRKATDIGSSTATTNSEKPTGGGGSKLRKPTNLWGVTRRISVKRKKVVEKKVEDVENKEEPRDAKLSPQTLHIHQTLTSDITHSPNYHLRHYTFTKLSPQTLHVHQTITSDITHSPNHHLRHYTFTKLSPQTLHIHQSITSDITHSPNHHLRHYTFTKLSPQTLHRLTGHHVDKLTGHRMDKLTGHRMDKLTGHRMDKLTGHRMDKLTGHRMDKLTGHRMDKLTSYHMNREGKKNF